MSDPYHHALSSAKKYGGQWQSFIEIHKWFDSTKNSFCDPRHRAILHNSFGIGLCIQVFGETIDRGDGIMIPTRYIAEQHVFEDMGRIPSIQDWLSGLPKEDWMNRRVTNLHMNF